MFSVTAYSLYNTITMAGYAKRRNTTILKALTLRREITTKSSKSKTPSSTKHGVIRTQTPEADRKRVTFKSPKPAATTTTTTTSPQLFKSPAAYPHILNKSTHTKIAPSKSPTVPLENHPLLKSEAPTVESKSPQAIALKGLPVSPIRKSPNQLSSTTHSIFPKLSVGPRDSLVGRTNEPNEIKLPRPRQSPKSPLQNSLKNS